LSIEDQHDAVHDRDINAALNILAAGLAESQKGAWSRA